MASRVDKYRSMIESGCDNEYIARRMGVEEETVKRWRRRLNGTVRSTGRRRNTRDDYKALFEQGKSNKEVASILGVQPDQAQDMRHLLGYAPKRMLLSYSNYGEAVTEAYNHNLSARTIATQVFGDDGPNKIRAVERIIVRARREGKVTRPKIEQYPPYTEEELAIAKRLLEDGASYREAQRTLGRPPKAATALSRRFPGMGWTGSMAGSYARMRKELEAL